MANANINLLSIGTDNTANSAQTISQSSSKHRTVSYSRRTGDFGTQLDRANARANNFQPETQNTDKNFSQVNSEVQKNVDTSEMQTVDKSIDQKNFDA